MQSNIQHLIDEEFSWIFVGGKGGVGKTTTSCALGMVLSKFKKSVLIISTDPAHNLSDSLDQKFGHEPCLVKGFSNLYAMEIDPEVGLNSMESNLESCNAPGQGFLKDLMGTLPGIDEAMSFAKVAELVNNMKYQVVVFDTAPTGHTLRLLSFPLSLSKTVEKFDELKNTVFPLMKQMGQLLGSDFDVEPFLAKVEATIPVIQKVSAHLLDNKFTTFVCVCIAEFLSMYETERLVQQLSDLKISVKTLVINQLVEKNQDSEKCKLCTSRHDCQNIYVTQMEDLFDNFHIIKAYLLPYEVRGTEQLNIYSKYLTNNI